MKFLFNRGIVTQTNNRVEISQEEIKNSSGLFRASLQDAIMYGGTAIQKALSSIELLCDYKYITVDAKVHMLMPGMIPAIPGWHTDGIPRSDDGSPSGNLKPFCPNLEKFDSPLFHLLIAGDCSPTEFLEDRNLSVDVPDEGTNDLYAVINNNLQKDKNILPYDIEEGYWYTWDWFELHKAQPAHKRGWRLLIRVTESDHLKPNTDLREVLRTQQQSYIPTESFGW